MEQKDYKFEIINELLKENNHVRELAKKMNINHMLIMRKMKLLKKENVVDYKEEGKNNVYFLKRNIESKSYIFQTEHYKLVRLIEKYPDLRGIIDKIQDDKRTELAIIFGSYAKGIAKKNSDIDIFIETNNHQIKKDLMLFNSRLSIKIGMYEKESILIKEIEKNHVIIKGVEKFYERFEFFK